MLFKKLTIVHVLFISFSCLQNKTESVVFNPPSHPHYKLIGEQNGYGLIDTDLHVFGMNFDLVALSDSLPPFYLMTCSWPDFTIMSDTTFGIGHTCDINFLNQEKLKKHDTLRLSTQIGTRKSINEDEVHDLFMALIIIDTIQLNYADSIGRNKWFQKQLDSLKGLPQNRCWSNNLQLKKMDATIESLL